VVDYVEINGDPDNANVSNAFSDPSVDVSVRFRLMYRSNRNALAMFLMNLRLKVSQRVKAFLFDCKHHSTVLEAFSANLTV